MTSDTARTCCSFAVVAGMATHVLLFAFGCRDFEAYTAVSILVIMAIFIGRTQDA